MKLIGIILVITGLLGLSGSILGGLILAVIGAVLIVGGNSKKGAESKSVSDVWDTNAVENIHALSGKVHDSWCGKEESEYSPQMAKRYEEFFSAVESLSSKERDIAGGALWVNLEPLFSYLAMRKDYDKAEDYVARAQALGIDKESAQRWEFCKTDVEDNA